MTQVLRIDALSHGYGDGLILDDFNLALDRGDHRLLLGPSGSGKTTLINLIAGLLRPKAGRIHLCGEELTGLPPARRDDLRRRHVGIIFQTLRLVGALDLRGNLLLAQKLAGAKRDEAAITALMERLGIAHRAAARPRELSQGEAQRAAIARALVAQPALLIADEPTSALDGANAARIARVLLDAAEANGSTLLIATHDARLRNHIPNAVALQPLREAA